MRVVSPEVSVRDAGSPVSSVVAAEVGPESSTSSSAFGRWMGLNQNRERAPDLMQWRPGSNPQDPLPPLVPMFDEETRRQRGGPVRISRPDGQIAREEDHLNRSSSAIRRQRRGGPIHSSRPEESVWREDDLLVLGLSNIGRRGGARAPYHRNVSPSSPPSSNQPSPAASRTPSPDEPQGIPYEPRGSRGQASEVSRPSPGIPHEPRRSGGQSRRGNLQPPPAVSRSHPPAPQPPPARGATRSGGAAQQRIDRTTVAAPFKAPPPGSGSDSALRECTICMEAFAEGEQVRTLQCLHKFHTKCIDRWLASSDLCPICKHVVGGSS